MTKKELTKDDRIKKEYDRLRKIFKDLPKDKMETLLSLLSNAAFMTVTLDDLQKTINREGVVVEYKNGENQYGTKKSPEVDIYNTMIKNHTSIMKQIAEYLPDQSVKDASEEILKFAFSGRK